MRRTIVLCIMLLLPVAKAWAQQPGTIAGRITAENGQPLVGAQITVEGTREGALSDAQGRYQFPRVAPGAVVLRVTLLGYASATQTVTVAAGGMATADFSLRVQAIELEGIVAVGYGTQRKVNLTGAVSTAKVEVMKTLPVPTVSQALQGVAPGLQIIDGGHQPGRNQIDILVRGQGTLGRGGPGDPGASRPLVLIDGVEGTMNTLDVDDIESVSVLMDAASAAIYGSRAANGVILITTKRGLAQQRVKIDYTGFLGLQDITAFPERVSVEDHMRLTNLAYTNAGRAPKYSAEYMQGTLSGADPLRFPSTNWLDLMFKPAPLQDHTVRVTGGSESARYALSLGYMKEDGLMPTTGADRYGVRLNSDFRASDRVTAGLDIAANRRYDIVPALNWESTFYLIHDVPPTVAARFPDGTWGWSDTNRNPLAYANESGDEQRRFYQGTVTGRVNFDILPGSPATTLASESDGTNGSQNAGQFRLQLQTLASVRYDNNERSWFRTNMRFMDYFDPTRQRANWGPNQLDEQRSNELQSTLRGLLNYGYMFRGAHDISGLLGYEQIQQDNGSITATRQNFHTNELRQINMGNPGDDNATGNKSEWALRSVFGRFNYNYQGRYMFEANGRYDGSSRFAEGLRYGFFPSVSAGWRVSEESFFKMPWINELKVRASWGQLGNQDVPLYDYYPSISVNQPYWFGGTTQTGAAESAMNNDSISWETTTVTDFGLDASFLNNRLTLSGDVYKRRTDDILLALPIPLIIGRSAPRQNAGVVQNVGWEAQVGWRDAVRGVNYGIDFSLSDNRNKVLDLVDTGPYIEGEMVVKEGYPIRSWYGYQALGYFQNQAEIAAHATQANAPHPGDLKFKDQNGDGIINEQDKVVIGDRNPRYLFSLNLSASWRNFDAGMFFQGVGKRDQYVALGLVEGPVWENYISKWHLDYWTPENPNARMPAPYLYQNYNQGTVSSWWVLDAKYVKMRNVQLGYTLPQNIADRVGVSRMRLYLAGKNLWQWTPMDIDLDPEFPWVRADYYPQTKALTFGTDISF
jgi:TonB-linked SusC/RagA family outer membrane protein